MPTPVAAPAMMPTFDARTPAKSVAAAYPLCACDARAERESGIERERKGEGERERARTHTGQTACIQTQATGLARAQGLTIT
jgi:hypothetical protein